MEGITYNSNQELSNRTKGSISSYLGFSFVLCMYDCWWSRGVGGKNSNANQITIIIEVPVMELKPLFFTFPIPEQTLRKNTVI